jgi:hypothetical protein
MILVNHSCAPNVGMGGNILLVSMREIAAGEELTIDYALFLGDPGFAMDCRCGAPTGRGIVRGTDWMRADLQERYSGWFSWLCVPKMSSTSCDQAVFVDQATDTSLPSDAVLVEIDRPG